MPCVIAGTDRVLGDVAPGPPVVVARAVARQRPELRLHLVGGLPGAQDHLADAAHRLRVGADHAQGAEVVQDVFGRDRLGANAALGEGHVLGDRPRQVMADHQHVEVLVDGIDRERPRRVGAGRQHVRQGGHADDVGGVAAAGAFRVIGVDRPAVDGGDGVLDEARLVERVGVNGDLNVELVGDGEAGVDCRRRRAPVLVQLQAAGAGADLLLQRAGKAAIPFAQKAEVDRQTLGRLQHPFEIPGAGGAGSGVGPRGRAGAAADQRRQPACQGRFDQLGADEMDVAVDPAGRQRSGSRRRSPRSPGRSPASDRRRAGSADCPPCRRRRCGRRGCRCPL